jgi:exodeoxyribonuclease V gamma subunit
VQAEWRRGLVPPGPLGARLLDTIANEVQPLAAAAMTHLAGTPEAIDVTVALPDGRKVTGTVGDVHGDTVVAVSYSKVSPKHRLRAWLNLLVLTAARPGTAWRVVTVGRGVRGKLARSSFGPIDATAAEEQLAALVAVADEGLCEPIPLTAKASHAYAKCRIAGGNPESAHAKARAEWTRYEGGGEADDAEHRLVWGPDAALDRLLDGDRSRFGLLAMGVWEPLCRAETMEQL